MLACRGGGVDWTACLVKPSAINELVFHGLELELSWYRLPSLPTLFLVKGAANNCVNPPFVVSTSNHLAGRDHAY
jgi:hypothetical protein